MAGVVHIAGCVTGPVRYKTLGHRDFATVEMTKRSSNSVRPLAAPVGFVADVGITILDTVATPIVSAPIAFEIMGPCPQPTTRHNVFIKIITSPIWFKISYHIVSIGMPFQKSDFYSEWFGQEADTFPEEKK